MPDYPERAVMEGLVNALIYRSYTQVGSGYSGHWEIKAEE